MRLVQVCDKILTYSFYLLFFLVPLILTPLNYELFEFNKMMTVYALTTIIVGAWLIKMVATRKFIFRRTPLDIPISIFLISQVLSFLFSIDPHVSLFGYYSRFHGGLLSTISYILLYYALVSSMDREKALSLVKVSLLSGLVVATYGILEHFGIDKDIWVQDVQTRVFSTLGQPNWLAAYLAILIPIAMAFALNPKVEYRNSKQFSKLKFTNDRNSFEHSDFDHLNLFRASDFGFRILFFYLLSFIFYLTLLYTKSRSGFLGFWVVNLLFWTGLFILSSLDKINSFRVFTVVIRPWHHFVFKNFLIINSIFLILTFVNGAPFSQINRFTAQELFQAKTPVSPSSKATGSALEIGGTESGEIRKIVWEGALDIARHYPLFGSGVETFAFSYYQFRPKEHNLVSEWDFLYNKAHNEYLNYAATTGLVGLGSYVLFITSFLFYFLKNLNPKFEYRFSQENLLKASNSKQFSKFKCPNDRNSFEHSDFDHLNLFRASDFGFRILFTGLFTGWLSILVTSFFGFSVVSVALFFWLIPAMTFVISNPIPIYLGAATVPLPKWNQGYTWVNWQKVTTFFVLFAICYLLFTILKFWYADTLFTQAFQLAKGDQHSQAYPLYHQAINLNPNEPFFRDELSYTASVLAVSAFEQNQATLSAQLVREAIEENKLALTTSPFNVNFWKTRTKIFYTLSVIDDKYNEEALEGLLTAQKLAPTDAKISYNLGLLYGRVGNPEVAIKTLKGTIELKPNYGDARYALALYYKEKGELNEAIDQLEYILTKISPEDAETKARLGEWKKE